MTKKQRTPARKPAQPKFTQNSPETCLPYIPLSQVISFKSPSQKNPQPLSTNMLGEFLLQNYTLAPSGFVQSFIEYQDQHAMGPVRDKLKSGMDEISCDYIDLHDRVIDAARLQHHCLVEQNALWTEYDRKLFLHNRNIMLNPPNEWMAQVNLEGNSIVTNCYGLIGFPQELFNQVNGKAIIDGGAFIGDTIPVFRNVFPNSLVYCFEPGEHNFNKMSHIFQSEIEAGHVKPVKLGLGNQSSTMQLSKVQGQVDSMASVKKDYKNAELTEQISVTTLDAFVQENHLEVGLFKLDVEGFEPEALQGAVNTLKEQKPVLVVAIYHTPEEFYELKGYLESLNLGYKFAIRRSSFTKPHTELVLIAY